jgi:uncharacterized iron-regulated membrane protein
MLEFLFGGLLFAWIILSLVWLSTFAQAGRTPWAKRGYRYRRVRWTTAIAATASFVVACVVAQGLPSSGKAASADSPVGARAAGAAPEASSEPADAATSSTVDIAPAEESDLAQPITEGQVTSGTTALCAAIFEAVGEAARTGKVDPDKTITQVKMLMTADATLTKELSISDARAQKILGVSIRRMEDQDPDGNVAEYCMNHR